MSAFEAIIKRGISDSIPRKLIINREEISFENKNRINETFTTFFKEEISEYRFGISWMQYHITFGREYIIEIKNFKGEILKINFKSYFGRNVKSLHQNYLDILENLWEYHFSEMVSSYLNLFSAGIEFSIGNVVFTYVGIIIKIDRTVWQKEIFIPWECVRTNSYATYFAIYSKENPSDINSIHNYFEDWNTDVLFSVIRTILRNKNIESYN
ncbi:hypothetical protein LRS05_09735 [Flavobacterium sp. J372]|uniref:hypothetical protein n=1 Tax=Flavobacterium sp. J372 TaxID=2898436 RepID=UPI0021511B4D|nr:hypothetical protein [Flavobacterium sp. J372]MCR5862411.1 hypothetical protein [Flavobacterium sp. J372]